MSYGLNIVFDCHDVDKVAQFWLTALDGYSFPGSPPGAPGSPPKGYTTWEEFADANGIPADQRYLARTIIDTTGNRPDIFFLKVPEAKTVKNRVHLDIKITSGLSAEEGGARKEAEAERLIAAGATRTEQSAVAGGPVVLRDVEGNEFCVT